jgi:hypothetical protein
MAEQPVKHILFPIVVVIILLLLAFFFKDQIFAVVEGQRGEVEKLLPKAVEEKEEVSFGTGLYIDPADPGKTKIYKFFKSYNPDYVHYSIFIPFATFEDIYNMFYFDMGADTYQTMDIATAINTGIDEWKGMPVVVLIGHADLQYVDCWDQSLIDGIDSSDPNQFFIIYDCGSDDLCGGMLHFRVANKEYLGGSNFTVITFCDGDAG